MRRERESYSALKAFLVNTRFGKILGDLATKCKFQEVRKIFWKVAVNGPKMVTK